VVVATVRATLIVALTSTPRSPRPSLHSVTFWVVPPTTGDNQNTHRNWARCQNLQSQDQDFLKQCWLLCIRVDYLVQYSSTLDAEGHISCSKYLLTPHSNTLDELQPRVGRTLLVFKFLDNKISQQEGRRELALQLLIGERPG
jgi:hypothetical protein